MPAGFYKDHDAWYPLYPVLGKTVAKHRPQPGVKLGELSYEALRAYGEAVGKAIRALQRSELAGAGPKARRCSCPSGTWHNDGRAIHAAIQQQQWAEGLAYPGKVRRARSPAEWQSMYEEAMRETHESLTERTEGRK